METAIKVIFRILALPFVAGIVAIALLRNYFFTLYLWLRNGGELLAHDKTFNPETMRAQFVKMEALIKTSEVKD